MEVAHGTGKIHPEASSRAPRGRSSAADENRASYSSDCGAYRLIAAELGY